MAYTDPTREGPYVPDSDQAYCDVATPFGEDLPIVKADVKLNEGKLHSCDRCGPAYIERELDLGILFSGPYTLVYHLNVLVANIVPPDRSSSSDPA
jgi:hypothetical protein